ncbi:MAG: glycosyltransferase family 2 protein [Blautia sp.]|nr:glycosyltransferase family 2 protein [Blautia sp.]
MKTFSFVIPCYRSEHTIEKVAAEIRETMAQRKEFDYEIICVNDCSPDNVYDVLVKMAEADKRVKVVNLAKNMGKHCAVMAGYSAVEGDYVVNIDDDCQSPVYELWNLMKPIFEEDYDVVTAIYNEKKESKGKKLGSDINLWVSEIMLDKPKGLRFENFSAMKRFVCDEMLKYKNPYPYMEGLILQVTKRITGVRMDQRERGDDMGSGFTLSKSIKLFANGFTSFSIKPLRVATIVGTLFAFLGFVFGLYIIIHKIIDPSVPMGYSSTMAVILFSNGLIMFLLGLIGEYVGRIFICINNSPQYVIRNTINVSSGIEKEA